MGRLRAAAVSHVRNGASVIECQLSEARKARIYGVSVTIVARLGRFFVQARNRVPRIDRQR